MTGIDDVSGRRAHLAVTDHRGLPTERARPRGPAAHHPTAGHPTPPEDDPGGAGRPRVDGSAAVLTRPTDDRGLDHQRSGRLRRPLAPVRRDVGPTGRGDHLAPDTGSRCRRTVEESLLSLGGQQAGGDQHRQPDAASAGVDHDRDPGALLAHLDGGGGLLGMHVAATSFTTMPRWPEILGGHWVRGTTMHPPLDLARIRLHAGCPPGRRRRLRDRGAGRALQLPRRRRRRRGDR